MGIFRYFNTFCYLFKSNTSPGILKEQIEEKKYFLEWGSDPQIYFRAEMQKYFRSFLVQMQIAKSPFEINGPLAARQCNSRREQAQEPRGSLMEKCGQPP